MIPYHKLRLVAELSLLFSSIIAEHSLTQGHAIVTRYLARGVVTMANAIDVFKKFYSELTKVLPMIINNLVTTSYSKELLSGDHKSRIESLLTDKEKTEYFLDRVIKPGLEIKYTKQFDEMLRVMRTSDDSAVNYLVDEMQKFASATTLSVDQKQAAGMIS